MFGYAFGQFCRGPLSDRFGRRPILLIGLTVYTLSRLRLRASAGGIDTLIALRLLQGFAAAAGPSVSRAIIRDYHGGPRAGADAVLGHRRWAFALVVAPMLGGVLADASPTGGRFSCSWALVRRDADRDVWRGFAES